MAQWRIDSHEWKQPHNVTLFEVMMLADQYGNLVGPANPSGVAVDAFGRSRASLPYTLFDSSHRYRDNGLWATSNTAGTTYAFNSNEGLVDLNLPTTADAEIVRETTKVFSYQPGKSLLILNTFVPATPKTNLRQRVGYFGQQNGIYFELDGEDAYFVKRSYVTGSLVETRIAQADWNNDNLLGPSANPPGQGLGPCPSNITLDKSKAQIMWMDIEWLGLGSVRCGFIIDGKLIHCHTFHHANIIESTYITTASLPLRYEIKNTGTTSSNSTMSQVCSSVISEGGYELRGRQRTAFTGIRTADLINLPTAGTFYPVLSLRLKSTHLDAIAVLKNVQILGVGNNTRLAFKLVKGTTLSGNTTFVSAGTDSCIEYNYTANDYSGGTDLKTFLSGITNQSQSTIQLSDGEFNFQFERNSLANTATIYTLVATGAADGDDCSAAFDWEEIN